MAGASYDYKSRKAGHPAPPEKWRSATAIIFLACVTGLVLLFRQTPMNFATPESTEQRLTVAQVDWNAGDSAQNMTFPLSSFECTDEEPLYQICLFKNLALFQAQLLYIVPNYEAVKQIELPSPVVFDTETTTLSIEDFKVPNIISFTTEKDLIKRINNSLERASEHRTSNSTLHTVHYNKAIFQRIRSFSNWYWLMNSASNTYHRICKYMDACTREQVREVALIQPKTINAARYNYASLRANKVSGSPSMLDLTACLGPMFWLDHPHLYNPAQWPRNQLILMDTVLFGVGTDVVQPNTALLEDDKITPLYPQADNKIAVMRTEFLRQCASLPPIPIIRKNPSVVLINRPFVDGRSILGLDEIYTRLKTMLPPEIPIYTHIPRGSMTLHEQASLFDKASILVIPHGAATANFNFLPLDAVVLDVFALERKWDHDYGILSSLPSPPYNLTLVPVNCSHSTEPMVAASLAYPKFKDLTPEQQLSLFTTTNIDELEDLVRDLLNVGIMDWMDFRAYHPNPETAAQAVVDAIALWRKKTAWRLQQQQQTRQQ